MNKKQSEERPSEEHNLHFKHHKLTMDRNTFIVLMAFIGFSLIGLLMIYSTYLIQVFG